MSASLFFILMATVYFSQNWKPSTRDVCGTLCFVVSLLFMFFGK